MQSEATKVEMAYIQNRYGGWEKKKTQIAVRDVLLLTGVFSETVKYIYSMPWVVYHNKTNTKFITSDDPIIVSDEGWHVPLSKDILLHISGGSDVGRIEDIHDPKYVEMINQKMIENAERFYVSASP